MRKINNKLSVIFILLSLSCRNETSTDEQMVTTLSEIHTAYNVPENKFASRERILFYDSSLKYSSSYKDSVNAAVALTTAYMEAGEEKKSIYTAENILSKTQKSDTANRKKLLKQLALAWLRLGERMNCLNNPNSQSCIFPINSQGLHVDIDGSKHAIEIYETLLKYDTSDLDSRWLLNLAYMTINGYPHDVPPRLLIRNLDNDSSYLPSFTDAAPALRLNINNQSGGSIVEDFNNDGNLDIVTSSWDLTEGMHYYQNNGNNGFTDLSFVSGLNSFTGGLNIIQTDYNNDGLKDIFVLRGAWKGRFGKEPNSLLRNNGNGTFTDVTRESGILSFMPTQTATWADFNNDGWLDVFIGNEAASIKDYFPCELYINKGDGSFTETASKANCDIIAFVKGVTSADYDNDGFQDIFISTLNGRKFLLKNNGVKNGLPYFSDATNESGLSTNTDPSFPTWFWDYNNDGWQDLLICTFEYNKSLAWYEAANALGNPSERSSRLYLYENNKDGTFRDVSEQTGANKVAFAMGSNFGDIDNDGYLDFYLGTGNPILSSLVPNRLIKNVNGEHFADITTSSRTGNLQKGHGVSFADIDNDGDVDIHVEMGGAYAGDSYPNSLYMNPGPDTKNNWIKIDLQGKKANRAGIGAIIIVHVSDQGKKQTIYRQVNSGGSFGANPLSQHIGVGAATVIDKIIIKWPGKNNVQELSAVPVNQKVVVTESSPEIRTAQLTKLKFAR